MLRVPLYFQNTTFLIDRFHQDNHIACSRAFFFSRQMPKDKKDWLGWEKTASVEARNADAKKITNQVSQMRKLIHADHVSHHFAVVNLNKIDDIKERMEKIQCLA